LLVLIDISTAQQILSMTVVPANPTTSDTIKIIIQNQFPSGGCAGSAYPPMQNGNTFATTALHCLGMLTVICTDYDTVILPPQPAGQYTFIFGLDAGQGPSPCTPGIVTYDTDSVQFTVTPVTGIENLNGFNHVAVFPNPSMGTFLIKYDSELFKNGTVKIFSAEGKPSQSFQLNETEAEITSHLPSGVYMLLIEGRKEKYFAKLVIVN
jgi:hypothetical protein